MASPFRVQKLTVAYLFIFPFFLLFAVFGAFPIIYSFILSFCQSKGVGKIQFIGLRNYLNLFQDNLFWKALWNTAVIWIISHALILPGAFLLAYVLDSVIGKGSRLFQTIFFTPMVTSSVAVALVFMTLFAERFGLINYIIRLLGGSPISWYGGTGFWIKPMIIILFTWKWIGWNIVIYFSGLQGIDQELYDCAHVEGANKAKILFSITVPMMKPIILFSLILSFIGGIQIFDEPYILLPWTGPLGGTNYAGLVLARYLHFRAFSRWHFGYGAAIAYFIVFLIAFLSALNTRLFGSEKP
jgi:ABC-type sugar transport system permease subunit